jgi:SAM-dependent methyltransferase
VTTWDGWEEHAAWWQTHFTEGADPEYEEQILPLAEELLAGATRVLDVGCGEGQLTRRMAAAGAQVAGIDFSAAQIVVAAARGGGPSYAHASVTALPFADASFDAVIACLVLEHVDDMETAVAEMGRVLERGGRMLVFLNHPLLQSPGSAWIEDHTYEEVERYWRVGTYLEEQAFVEPVAKDVLMRFVHRPLHRYVNAMVDAGVVVTGMQEPPPPPGFLAIAPEYQGAAFIPRLMVLRGHRVAS